jgi:hypothetical protein
MWYRRLQRTPEQYILDIFLDNTTHDLDELTSYVNALAGITFKRSTIKTFLDKYMERRDMELPLQEDYPNRYRLAIPYG